MRLEKNVYRSCWPHHTAASMNLFLFSVLGEVVVFTCLLNSFDRKWIVWHVMAHCMQYCRCNTHHYTSLCLSIVQHTGCLLAESCWLTALGLFSDTRRESPMRELLLVGIALGFLSCSLLHCCHSFAKHFLPFLGCAMLFSLWCRSCCHQPSLYCCLPSNFGSCFVHVKFCDKCLNAVQTKLLFVHQFWNEYKYTQCAYFLFPSRISLFDSAVSLWRCF